MKSHIFAQMKNITEQEVVLEVGERVVRLSLHHFDCRRNEADGVDWWF